MDFFFYFFFLFSFFTNMWRQLSKTKLISLASATTATASFAYYMNEKSINNDNVYKRTIKLQEQSSELPGLFVRNKAFAEALQEHQQRDFWLPPSREEMINRLKDNTQYDLLVVGGGATGAGISVDAVTRGLKVAMVERDDFAAGKMFTRIYII
jgi:glycerol-3-phosphate dehydrogenase